MAHCLSPGSIGTAWESIKNVQEKCKDFYWSKLKRASEFRPQGNAVPLTQANIHSAENSTDTGTIYQFYGWKSLRTTHTVLFWFS